MIIHLVAASIEPDRCCNTTIPSLNAGVRCAVDASVLFWWERFQIHVIDFTNKFHGLQKTFRKFALQLQVLSSRIPPQSTLNGQPRVCFRKAEHLSQAFNTNMFGATHAPIKHDIGAT